MDRLNVDVNLTDLVVQRAADVGLSYAAIDRSITYWIYFKRKSKQARRRQKLNIVYHVLYTGETPPATIWSTRIRFDADARWAGFKESPKATDAAIWRLIGYIAGGQVGRA